MKKILLVLPILFFAAACNLKNPPPVTQSKPPVTQQQTTPPTDPTANWGTYHNEKYGFEFKYPNTWQINAGKDGESVETSPDLKSYIHGGYFSASVDSRSLAAIQSSFVKQIENKTVAVSMETMGGKEAYFYSSILSKSSRSDGFVENNGVTLHIVIFSDGSIADTVLSTFKFTNSN